MNIVIGVILALSAGAQAAAASGKVVHAAGDVRLSRGDQSLPMKKGAEVKAGDVVRTGRKATAVLELSDGTVLKLREKSQISVAADSPGGAAVSLDQGGVFAKVIRRVAEASGAFRLRTPTAVASVRGTEFFTAYGRKKRKASDLWLCVNTGSVDVESLVTQEKTTVKAGNGILIPAGKGPTKPQAYDWTKTLNWNMDPGEGAVEDATSLEAAYSDLLDQDYR